MLLAIRKFAVGTLFLWAGQICHVAGEGSSHNFLCLLQPTSAFRDYDFHQLTCSCFNESSLSGDCLPLILSRFHWHFFFFLFLELGPRANICVLLPLHIKFRQPRLVLLDVPVRDALDRAWIS